VYHPVLVGITSGVIVGRVVEVKRHPNADRIRMDWVDLGIGETVQIVFGGPPNVHAGDLVPVAPPGSRLPGPYKMQKMRRRRYRGQSSHGMLCSLAELGWNPDGPDEVALLRDVTPGDSLDKVTATDWQSLAIITTSTSESNFIHDAKRLPNMAQDPNPAKACVDVSSHSG
jgi:phenylalanyl-tRNA synthetase beta chain